MAKFLIEATYTVEGVRGIQSAGGSSRRDAVAKALESAGGSLESFHFGFGSADAYVIADAPDNVTAAAVALTVNATGAAQVNTVVLLTPEEVDEAAQKSVSYTPPGG
jgi:uncharacterized protein with GYD domain